MTRRERQFNKARAALPFTQAELAKLLGVHPVTVSKWARGVLSPSSESFALVLAIATGWQWSVDWRPGDWRVHRAPGRPDLAEVPQLAYWESVRRAIESGDRPFALFLALWPTYGTVDPPGPLPKA